MDTWVWHQFLEDRDRFWISFLLVLTIFFLAFLTRSPVATSYWQNFATCGFRC